MLRWGLRVKDAYYGSIPTLEERRVLAKGRS